MTLTLKDIIDKRGNKYDDDLQRHVPMDRFWQGYQVGWKMAYQDLREILDQHGFDKNIIVIKEEK